MTVAATDGAAEIGAGIAVAADGPTAIEEAEVARTAEAEDALTAIEADARNAPVNARISHAGMWASVALAREAAQIGARVHGVLTEEPEPAAMTAG